jgi:hypothetical protein
MKLPGGSRATVDIAKLRDYCLNPEHPRGRYKARVFAAAGISRSDAEELREALLAAAGNADAQTGFPSEYGGRYTVDFDFDSRERTTRIRSAWIVRIGEDYPRLTACYVL